MHIVDGALSTPVLVAGGIIAAAGVAKGLSEIDAERMPQVGVLGATFFVASLIHVPLGPSSVHLILNGLMGLLLGWAAFPALLVALLLQAAFFGFGGVTVLGVNTVVVALPAVITFHLFGRGLRNGRPGSALVRGFAAGAGSVALTTVLAALALAGSGQEFLAAAALVFVGHLPVMGMEGVLTGAAVVFLQKVKPEALGQPLRAPV